MNTYALRHRLCFLGILFFLVIMLPAPALGAEESVRIKVIKDESLKSFCRKHLEDPNLWPEIGRYNHLADFDLIRAGSYLMVPLKLQKGKPVQGRVTFVKGEVFIRRNAGSGKKPLQIDDMISTGDIITTGPQSAVEVDFENRCTFYASPHTQVKVAVSEAKGLKYLVQRFVLITGNIVTKVRSATGSASRTVIQTPHATSAVRGTHFRVAVHEEQSTTTEVLQGKVDVTAKGVKVALQEGQGTKVNKGHAPIAPVTLLDPPTLGDTSRVFGEMPLKVTFSPVPGARHYRFQLSRDRDAKDVVRDTVVEPGDSLAFDTLDDGSYYLQGRSIDAIGLEGPFGDPRELTVRAKPAPPFIQQPGDGALYRDKKIAFSWTKVADAVRYEMQVSPEKEFTEPLTVHKSLADVSSSCSLNDYGTYYFRIRSMAKDGFKGPWSDVVQFSASPPPPSPELEKPRKRSGTMVIRWRDQGPKMSYHCQIARDQAFSDLIVDRKTERPLIEFPRPKKPGTYYVRTSTIDDLNYEGAFSAPQTFEIHHYWPLFGIIAGAGIASMLIW